MSVSYVALLRLSDDPESYGRTLESIGVTRNIQAVLTLDIGLHSVAFCLVILPMAPLAYDVTVIGLSAL